MDLNTTSFSVEKGVPWYITTVVLILICILATLGNLMVLLGTWLEKILHQPNKYFIACLAVADLLVGIFSTPLRLYQHLNYGKGITSLSLCRFYIWIDVFAESASILTLTFISFDRYLKINNPFRYKVLMTNSKALIVISSVWLTSTCLPTFGMFPYAGDVGIYIAPGVGCNRLNIVFDTFAAVVAFFLPTFIILVMYARIFLVAHRRREMAQSGDLGPTHEVRNQRLRSTIYQDLKNIRMLAIVIGAFICCWGPFFTLTTLSYHNPEFMKFPGNSTVLLVTVHILPASNSVFNPIIYASFDETYKEAFKRLFQRVKSTSTSSNVLGVRSNAPEYKLRNSLSVNSSLRTILD